MLSGCSGEVATESATIPACAGLEEREGSCERDDGSTARIVERSKVLRLRQLRARLLSLQTGSRLSGPGGTAKADPGKVFVIARLSVTNDQKRFRPSFAHPRRQVFLYVDGEEYGQDLGVERRFLADSFAARRVRIRPGGRATGRIAIQVPRGVAAGLRRRSAHPELAVLNFSEAGRQQPREVGFFLLSRPSGA